MSSNRVGRGWTCMVLVSCTLWTSVQSAGAQDTDTSETRYGKWENLGALVLANRAEWLAYRVTRVNEENELRIKKLSEDSVRVVAWGRDPVFSVDDRWLAYTIDVSSEERERLESAEEPVRLSVGLLDLEASETRTFDAVRTYAFDSRGQYLALHGYAPDEPEGRGANLRIVDLRTGTEATFGNVSAFAWSDQGSLVALTIATGEQYGNGIQVYDAAAGTLKSLDVSGRAYSGPSWRADAADLAVLRSRDSSFADSTARDVLAWRGLDGPTTHRAVLNADVAGIPDTLVVVESRTPQWSDDGSMISIGLRPTSADETSGNEESDEEEAREDSGDDEEPNLPGVQIWHTSDVRLFPQQKAAENADRRRTLLAVWHIDVDRVVTIGSDLLGSAQLLEGWRIALEDLDRPYPWGAMFGRRYHDVWTVDVQTGARERLLERVRYEWASPTGQWLVSFDGSDYSSHNLETGETLNITADIEATFADTTYDTPTDMLPPHGFGPGGWFENDGGVLLYDEYDVWRVALDGSGSTRLTNGTADRLIHRVAFMPDDDQPGLNPNDPVYLTLHGEWTEQRGYAWVRPDGDTQTLLLDDAYVSALVKADSVEVFAFRSMAFDDPPDYFLAGPNLANASRVTDINPFFAETSWGRSELVDFSSESGRELQAVLRYPAGYEPGTRVPMIVYTYEMLSPQMHFFEVPDERDYYNFTVWTQNGYAVLLPDIVYRAREPGLSALESVRAAVAKVVEMGVADPNAVGLIGHSWGGYQATFLPTRTNIFAASVAGAPLTNFVSMMGAIHWNPGVPEVDHWETGQARMEVPFWEDPEAHRRNSPIHKVHELETPLLMAFGDQDGVVDWDQGTEFFNFARRAGKQMVLLVYEGEDHGFRQEPNQVDYHRRILEWFGHYLKGEPPADWITKGVPLDDLEDEKRRVAKGNG